MPAESRVGLGLWFPSVLLKVLNVPSPNPHVSAAKMFILFITGANNSGFQASPAGRNGVGGVKKRKQETSEYFSNTMGHDVWM